MAPASTWAPVGARLHHGRYLLSRHGLGRTVAKGRAQDATAMGKGRRDGTTQQLLKQDGVTERQKHGAIERSYAGRHQEFIRLPNRGFTGYINSHGAAPRQLRAQTSRRGGQDGRARGVGRPHGAPRTPTQRTPSRSPPCQPTHPRAHARRMRRAHGAAGTHGIPGPLTLDQGPSPSELSEWPMASSAATVSLIVLAEGYAQAATLRQPP